MSLDLINVGVEPNDGTGDPPRVAGQKINANFQELYQALEATEPTTALNARDTANRDRANHTGTQTAATIADFAPTASAAAPVQSVAGRTGEVTLAKADVGLDQVDNTPDAEKPISTAAQAVLDLKLEADDIAAFETNAQLDSRDTANRARANHTGSQAISTVTGLQTALDAKLEAPAIASFETTTQLNGRDTANRARANHTGTQPASSITGLPFGFTYDQQTEPTNPTAGQTWRERSSGGLIVGDWEWIGSLWCALRTDTVSLGTAVSAAGSWPGLNFQAPRCLFIQCRISTNPSTNPSTPFDSSNYRELYLGRRAGTVGATVFTFRPMINLSQSNYVSNMNYLNPDGAGFFTGTTTVGAPGTINLPSLSYVYREVRS